MKTEYITVNWNKFYKLVNDQEGFGGQFFLEIEQIRKRARKYETEKYREFCKVKRAEMIAKLKSLPIGTEVFYTGSDLKLLSIKMKKSGDGRDYMKVGLSESLQGSVHWKIPYERIQLNSLTDIEKDMRKLGNKLSETLNEMI